MADDLEWPVEESVETWGENRPESHTALPARVEAWRRRTATGALLTGIARGFGEVFEPEREPAAIVAEAPGEPFGPPRPVEAILDPDDPSASSLVVRRWLMEGADRGGDGDAGAPGEGPGPAA
ncbi:MAG TPA: hypothetical protein VFW24_05790 [Acidimicrobiales bacterium]|nr:hypothetical protein [Acidimicrobiales bacterium]